MDSRSLHFQTGLVPTSFCSDGSAAVSDIALGVHCMLESIDVTRDMKSIVISNDQYGLFASIDGFAQEPHGWPKLQQLHIRGMDCPLFPVTQVTKSPSVSPFPVLRSLTLQNIPGAIDGQVFFSGLARMLQLQHLEMYRVRFRTWLDSAVPPKLPFRLKLFSFIEEQDTEQEGNAQGWHWPIAASGAKCVEMLLNEVDTLSPLFEDPRCLSDVEELVFIDSGRSPGRCLPMEAYAGIPKLCPKLQEIYLIGIWDFVGQGLTAMLADLEVPLRRIYLRFYSVAQPTQEALNDFDLSLADLLCTSRSLRHLRLLNIDASFGTLLECQFAATRSQCILRGIRFYHKA